MNLTVYEVLRGFHEMQDDVKKLFAYLNGRVNTLNLCTLNIMYYSRLNYAQFQYPNIVTVFLSSILDEFYFDDGILTKRDRVLTVLALTMTHELFHADQCVDPLSYKKDPSYSSNVEYAAEYNAEKFCLSHKRELENLLGFRYSLTGKITSPYGEYNNTVIQSAKQKEYFTIQWNIDTLDYEGLTGEQMWQRIENKLEKGSIILSHNGTEHTADSLDMLIKNIQSKGYQIVKISELIYTENYSINNNGTQIKNNE